MDSNLERKCLEILADAVDETIGSGFVHTAIVKASVSLASSDLQKADSAFRLLTPRESTKIRSTALDHASTLRDFGDYSDPFADAFSNPKFGHIRSSSRKLGAG